MNNDEPIKPEDIDLLLEKREQEEEELEEPELEIAPDFPETPAAAPTHDYQTVNKAFVDALEVALKAYADTAEADAKTHCDAKDLVTPSDVLKESDDTEDDSQDDGSYVLTKEIEVDVAGKIKTKFDLKKHTGATNSVFGKIYVNDVAVGDEHENATSTYVTYTDTDIDVESGDLVQLYTKTSGNKGQIVRNFRLYWDVNTSDKEYIDNTQLRGVGDNIIAEANTEAINFEATPYREKEVELARGDKVRISFDLCTSVAGQTGYAKVYLNGSAVGTERTSDSETYATFTEDLDVSKGDLIQLYAWLPGGGTGVKVRNFKVKTLYYEVATVVLD